AINAVGTDIAGRPNWDIYPHGIADAYLSFSSTAASATNYSAKLPSIPPGTYGRVLVLTDYTFNIGMRAMPTILVDPMQDRWGTNIYDYFVPGRQGITNQKVYENGGYHEYYPSMNFERGLPVWSMIRYENIAYPPGTTCDRSGAQPELAGPVTVEIPQ
ncbi:MAG TPA: hypothetical protein VFR01_08840, partial [Geobacterales bacterium]|nr:hypothetical protein [Geobacterales bacterium]